MAEPAGGEHPLVETLQRLVDGTLPPAKAREAAAHADECPECGVERRRLQMAADLLRPNEAYLSRIMEVIQEWLAQAQLPGHRDAVNRRVIELLAPYLGRAGAAAVVEPVANRNDQLLARVESVLAMFLGVEAAAAVVNQIVSEALVGDRP